MAIKSRTSSSPPTQLDAPLLTILDLWYTRNGGRAVHFSYEQIEDGFNGDWLMQNMALVAKGIVRNGGIMSGGQWVERSHPYGVTVFVNRFAAKVGVIVFLEEEYGDS